MECDICGDKRKINGNGHCLPCNLDLGIKQCRGCGEILPVALSFYAWNKPNGGVQIASKCVQCISKKNKTGRPVGGRSKLSGESLEKARDLYLSGKSLAQVAREFGVSGSAVNRALTRAGVTIRPDSCRRHQLDESFFDSIDSEEKAYWLGFLTADGNVYGTRIQVSLSARDVGHLEKLRAALKCSAPIRNTRKLDKKTGKEYKLVTLAFRSKRMAAQLSRHSKPWQGPDHLMCHYWRGVFDGDGCCTEKCVGLSGTLEMVSQFIEYVRQNVRTNTTPTSVGRIWSCQWRSAVRWRVINLIYKDSNIYLQRKYNVYLAFVGSTKPGVGVGVATGPLDPGNRE